MTMGKATPDTLLCIYTHSHALGEMYETRPSASVNTEQGALLRRPRQICVFCVLTWVDKKKKWPRFEWWCSTCSAQVPPCLLSARPHGSYAPLRRHEVRLTYYARHGPRGSHSRNRCQEAQISLQEWYRGAPGDQKIADHHQSSGAEGSIS